jgi:hypothetical protein
LLAGVAVLLGVVSCCLSPLSLVAFGLGLAARILAKQDLVEMARGRMDPSGLQGTAAAHLNAGKAIVLCLLTWVAAGAVVVIRLL